MNLRLAILTLLFFPLLGACGFGQPQPLSSQELTETAVAFDVIVQATLVDVLQKTEQAGGSGDADGEADKTLAPTHTETPTQAPATPTPSPTDTPDTKPVALVRENTNCRSGPGTVFKILYIAMAGDELDIRRISTLVDYVLVEIPGKPGELCWLWTNFAELRGNYASLPMSTPPPTPTPVIDFNVVYDYMDGCVGWDPAFKLTNIGAVTFKSYYVTVTDSVSSMTQDHTSNNFDQTSGCPIVTAIPQLDPGMTGWAHAYSFPYNPTGNPMTGSIKLCTGTGLSGTCVTKPLSFVP